MAKIFVKKCCLARCFLGFVSDLFLQPLTDAVIGMPIDKVLSPIPPIDITDALPTGTSQLVTFSLKDYGVIAGNSPLYLVFSSNASGMGTIPSEPDLSFEGSTCGGGVQSISVTNIGNARSDPTLVQFWAQRVLPAPPYVETAKQDTITIRALDPGEPLLDLFSVTLGDFAGGCPIPGERDNYCEVDAMIAPVPGETNITNNRIENARFCGN
jgi:hypothetical protein